MVLRHVQPPLSRVSHGLHSTVFAVSEANVSVPSMRAAGGGAAMQAEAVAELTRALGRPPAAVFAHLPSVPAAAASLGQVRARCL